MTTRYVFDPRASRLTVQAFATGMLSFLGHSPTFVVRDFVGALQFDPADPKSTALDLSIAADSLSLTDPVRAADRTEIEGRMRREVLETADYPTITFQTEDVAARSLGAERYHLELGGWLSLHGITHPYQVEAELIMRAHEIALRGDDQLGMADFGIRPVTAVGGTIRLKDEVRVMFEFLGFPEQS